MTDCRINCFGTEVFAVRVRCWNQVISFHKELRNLTVKACLYIGLRLFSWTGQEFKNALTSNA